MKVDLSISGPSVDEVLEYEIITEAEAEKSEDELDPHPAADTLREFAVDVAAKKSEDSAERYYRGVKPLVAWLDTERDITNPVEADGSDVGDYLKWLVNTPWARNSRSNRFAACQRFYRWARDEGPLEENLTEDRSIKNYDLDPGELEKSRRETDEADDYKWIDRAKAVKLWKPDNIPSPRVRNELILKLLWYTTCRTRAISEAFIAADDPDDGLNREEGKLKVPNLKKGDDQADYRWVYYPNEIIEPLLQQWLDQGHRNASPYAKESDRLFVTNQKPFMRPSYISRQVKEAGFNADIQEVTGYDVHGNPRWKVTGHCLRHSAATWYANETPLDVHFLKKQMGHSKLETTMKYVHDHRQSRKRAFQRAWNLE